LGGYENFTDVEIRAETHRTAQEILSGEWASISKPWELRRDAMLDILSKATPYTFKPLVQLDSTNTVPLSQALSGRSLRFYEKQTEKKNWHVVNAFTLLLARMELWKNRPKTHEPRRPQGSWMTG